MAIFRPDIYQHNNPNLAIADSDFVYGGFRSSVENISDLFALSGKTGLPTAKGQLKEHATVVYVSGVSKYYILKDIDNVDNINGWEEFGNVSGGSSTFIDLNDTPTSYTGQDGKWLKVSGNSLVFIDEPISDIDGDNVGDGTGLIYSGKTGTTLQFRTLKGVGSTIVTTNGDVIEIQSSSGTTNVDVDNIGSGIGLFSGKTGTTLQFRTLIGSGDTTVTQSGDTVVIYSSGGSSQPIFAGNGLTLSVNTINLGGEITQDTIISGITNDFTINTDTITLQSISGVNIIDTNGGSGINLESDGGDISFIANTGVGIEKYRIDLNESGSTITDNTDIKRGIEYAENYHVTYSNRSLVDKEYVDNKLEQVHIATTNYLLSSGDSYVGVSGASTITLMPSPIVGKKIYITDIFGTAYSNNIIINGNGNNINGQSNAVINTNYGSITIMYNGYGWSVIGFVN